jgi:hypothetical protein
MAAPVAAAISAAVAAAALLAPSAPASAAASLTQVPYAVDSSNQAGWWSPLDTYRGNGEYAYLAFNEPGSVADRHRVAVARRDPSGSWTRLPAMRGTSQPEFPDDIGHNQPSLARDGSGRFHVFAAMHNDTWRYFRSDVPGGAPQDRSTELPDQGALVTYPVLATSPDGDVYLLVRIAESDTRSGRLYRWDDAAARWSRVAVVAREANRSVYPDDLQFDSAGNLHILFEWSLWPSAAFRHELSYLRYRPSDGVFTDRRGVVKSVPVSTATADVIQPLETGERYEGNDSTGPAVQSAKLTLDGTSPKVAYRYRSASSGGNFHIRYAWVNSAGNWSRETVYSAGQTRAAVDITWHPTEGKRVYYVRSSGSDRVFMATKPGSSWNQSSVAPGRPIERLAVDRNASGQDVLYLMDVVNRRLFYGTT